MLPFLLGVGLAAVPFGKFVFPVAHDEQLVCCGTLRTDDLPFTVIKLLETEVGFDHLLPGQIFELGNLFKEFHQSVQVLSIYLAHNFLIILFGHRCERAMRNTLNRSGS